MAEVYKVFVGEYLRDECDWSDQAARDMYRYESLGGVGPGFTNGYFTGKHLMDVTIKMWKDDLNGKLDNFPLLIAKELYTDGKFPHWWLDGLKLGYSSEEYVPDPPDGQGAEE